MNQRSLLMIANPVILAASLFSQDLLFLDLFQCPMHHPDNWAILARLNN